MAARDCDGCVKLFRGLDEFRRGPRMQALLVDDLNLTDNGNVIRGRAWTYLPLRTRLAMVQYLRPAS
jgi:hypothetical protein